jgi:C-terminal processing protease CtpA/Prc
MSTTATAAPADAGEAEDAVRIAASRIEQDYVDASKARGIAAALRKRARAMRRHSVEGDALARDLTQQLRSLSGDPHFRLGYSPEAMPPNVFEPKAAGDEAAARRKTARINNYGVLRAERLPGNIGFIDLDQFTDPALMRGPLAAAMELLRYCDAMIIDLRFNGGGHARGAALTASYFLPERPERLLVTLQTRDPGQALPIRTEASLEAERFLDRPVYILTSDKTFSAAEFLAASLQQAGRAIVVGTRTRGGGNPVARVRLTPHYALLLPTTRGVTPDGTSWEGVGIRPDIEAGEKDALRVAQRAALTALLGGSPNDMFADNWRRLLAELGPAAAAAPTAQGASR